MKPKIGVAYPPGTNCHEESAYVVDLAGGEGVVVLVHDLVSGRAKVSDYQGFIFPGGFSWGDHIAAGRVLGVQVIAQLKTQFQEFALKHPVMGICNGYQVLMEMGLLPSGKVGERTGALTQNDSARFESRWTRLLVQPTGSFWTAGMEGKIISMPLAHAEGRMVLQPGLDVKRAFLYVDEQDKPTETYPANPAGSPGGTAGIVDPSGMVLGMMPHPERASLAIQGSTDGLALFQNMIRYCIG
jgi:phosphoribosylformylglycinamidine synthase